MNSRQRLIAAAYCETTDRPPVWLMRQAGRYLPEYRALKEKHDFVTLVRTPDLATEVTLQPMRRFPLDAAILFSDILVIPEAMGVGYAFRDGGGIQMERAVRSAAEIDALSSAHIAEKLSYVADAIRQVRGELGEEKALLGFAGSPWTLACYLVEGGSSGSFQTLKTMALADPGLFNRLLDRITEAVAKYLVMQVEAGVDAVQIFDSWGAACPAIHYDAWSLSWIRKLIARINQRVPVILFAKGMGHKAPDLIRTGADVISVDWTINLRRLRQSVGHSVAVQGNLDPVVLTTTPEITRREVGRVLDEANHGPGFLFNLGHGMLPDARIECVEELVATVLSSGER